MSKHRVRTHLWNMGILETIEHLFDSEEEAHTFAGTISAHTVKVYNPDGELLSTRTAEAVSTNTYA